MCIDAVWHGLHWHPVPPTSGHGAGLGSVTLWTQAQSSAGLHQLHSVQCLVTSGHNITTCYILVTFDMVKLYKVI